jgi:hypothetical protein
MKKNKKQIKEMSAMAGGAVAGAPGVPDDYYIDRKKFLEELKLREVLQKMVKTSKTKVLQEQKLRGIIRKLITEAESDIAPYESTAINFLKELLKKILPTIETDYKSLTTKREQRDSFRSHIINSSLSTLKQADMNLSVGAEGDSEFIGIEEAEEDSVDIAVIDDSEDEKFIDIEDKPTEEEAEEEVEEFPPDEGDDTGRKMAVQTFEKIEKQILDTYDTLSDTDDLETFKDYLITNLKLYFDKWEKELGEVIEPTTDEYEKEKSEMDTEMDVEGSGEEELEL